MPQIPLYESNVTPTSQVGGVEASADTGVFRAASGLGETVSQIGFGMASRQKELNQQLASKRLQAERSLLELDAKNRIDIAKNAYESGLEVRNDYENFGTDSDKEYGTFSQSVSDILSDPKLKNHPELLSELKIHASSKRDNARIDAGVAGVKELQEQGKATFAVSYDQAIKTGNSELAIELTEKNPFITDAERIKMQAEIPQLIDHKKMTNSVYDNPAQTIKDIDAQLSGKDSTWGALSKEDLKSGRSYAKMILNERQQKAQDSLYTPDSGYQELSPSDKQAFINEQHDNGLISSKAWKAEAKRIKNPSMSDIKPEDNQAFIELQRRLFAAVGDPEGQIVVLNDVTASQMPMPMRTQLYDMQRDIASPTGKTKSASYTYARETMGAVFNRSNVIAEVAPWWNIAAERPSGFTEESRGDLMFRAHAEAESELFEWMRATPDFNEAQINAKVYEIVGQKSKEYGISQIPIRLSEGVLAPEASPEPGAPLDEPVLSKDDVQAVIDEVVAEMPDATDDEKRAEITKRLGK